MTVSHQATYEWIYARPKGELRQLAEQQVALGTSLFGDVLTVVGLGIEVAAFFVSSPVLTAALAVAGVAIGVHGVAEVISNHSDPVREPSATNTGTARNTPVRGVRESVRGIPNRCCRLRCGSTR